MKVAFVGSREFADLDKVRRHVRQMLPGTEIVSGGAGGVDSVAEAEARALGLKVTVIRPDYATHGRIAPLLRNRQIIEAAEQVVAYWDGLSGGTANAIAWATALGKNVAVHWAHGQMPESTRKRQP